MSEYNTDLTLLKTSIESIINQTYSNFELIIIDDCGQNDVMKLVDEFKDKRIKIYKNKKNMGLVYSLNKALKLSKGKYIARMDTDDFSFPNRLELEVSFLENNPQYDLVGSNIVYYDGQNIWGETNRCGDITRNNLLKGCPLFHPTVMYKKDIIEKNGGYLDFNRCEDYATWIELFVNGCKMYVIKEKLLRYHLSESDYVKRTLNTRKGFFKMLKSQYIKLKPSKICLIKMYIKTFIAGIIPGKIMFLYHKRKAKL